MFDIDLTTTDIAIAVISLGLSGVSPSLVNLIKGKSDSDIFTRIVLYFHKAEVFEERWGFSFRNKETKRYIAKAKIRLQARIVEQVFKVVIVSIWPTAGYLTYLNFFV